MSHAVTGSLCPSRKLVFATSSLRRTRAPRVDQLAWNQGSIRRKTAFEASELSHRFRGSGRMDDVGNVV